MFAGWQRDATIDPVLIARHWRSEPGPNIGIITGETFVAFDIEADHLTALRDWLLAEGHRLPDTPIARSGRRGIHILTKATGDSGHTLHLDGVHIGELKSKGGFIVVCPSRTSGPYEWIRSPLDRPVADAPDWLVGLVDRRPTVIHEGPIEPIGLVRGERRLAALERTVRAADEGSRNSVLYWAARCALEDGVPETVAAAVLARAGIAVGLGDREVAATIRSALGRTAR